MEALDKIYDSIAEIIMIQTVEDLGTCVHGVPWRLNDGIDWLHVVHHAQ